MDVEKAAEELTERKVVRRGLLAGIAGLGAAAALKISGAGKANKAEATNGQDLKIGNVAVDGFAQSAQSITTLNCDPAFDSFGLLVANGNVPAIPGRVGVAGGSNGATGAGVYGHNSVAGGSGVWGDGIPGVLGRTTLNSSGVRGVTTNASGIGVQGVANAAADFTTNGTGAGTGVLGKSGSGNGVKAESGTGIALLAQTALSGATTSPSIQGQTASTGEGVRGVHGLHGIGVLGVSNTGGSFTDTGSGGGIGVRGQSTDGFGVQGRVAGNTGIGTYGANSNNGTGVKGLSNTGGSFAADGNGSGIGVHGKASNGHGVLGESAFVGVKGQATGNGVGLVGTAVNNFAIYGASTNYVGLWGESQTQVGISAVTNTPGQPALYLLNTQSPGPTKFGALIDGNVVISGSLQVMGGGNKNALVPHPDGMLRTLYCQESPEAWFEDFGRAQMVAGVARVSLDPEFAAVVITSGYHVFPVAEGNSNGLFVTNLTPSGFEVREANGGTHTLAFSYRIVARRKDVAAPRLAKVDPKIGARPAAVAAAMAAQKAGNNPGTGPLPPPPLPPVGGPTGTNPVVPPTQTNPITPPGSMVDRPRGQ